MCIFTTEFTDKGHSCYLIGDTDFAVDFSGGTSGGIPGVPLPFYIPFHLITIH